MVSLNLRVEELLYPRVSEEEIKYQYPTRDLFFEFNEERKRENWYFLELLEVKVFVKLIYPSRTMNTFDLKRSMTIVERADVKGSKLKHVGRNNRKIIENKNIAKETYEMMDHISPHIRYPSSKQHNLPLLVG